MDSFSDAIRANFEKLYGQVDDSAIQEVIWKEPEIVVHIIRPNAKHECLMRYGSTYEIRVHPSKKYALQFRQFIGSRS